MPLARLKGQMEIRKDFQKNLKCKNNNYQCGEICLPRNKKCRLSEQQLNKIVEKIEDEIKDLPQEQAIVINNRGQVILRKGGDETSVYLTYDDLAKMRGNIVTHNHPNLGFSDRDARSQGFSFSSADIQVACYAEVKEMRAVSSGFRHSLKPPDSGWNSSFWDKKVKPTYKKHENQVYREYGGKVITGKMKIDVAERDYHHEVIRRTAEELKMTYKREEIK